MRAVLLNCSLKPSTEASNTQMLADTVIEAMAAADVKTTTFRLADLTLDHGVETTMSDADQWPEIHDAILEADILVVATPTWVGHPSSYAQQALERLDAMISETDDEDTPVAYGKVAGVVVTGNEDGAHHVISEIAGGLIDIGFTIPGQAWTYWNRGPGPGPSFSETDAQHDWSEETGRTMAQQLVRVAHAMQGDTVKS
jgi:multimeric flavodoxin WrbA